MALPKLSVVTPWYPSLGNPVLGNFVADWGRLALGGFDIRVVNTVEWPGGAPDVVQAQLPAFNELVGRMGAEGALDSRGSFGTITRVPHALVGGWSVPQRAESAVRAVRRAVPDLRADVVHGHVGYFGGLVAARLASPEARVIVTEHSSELGNVLADASGRELYAEVLERAAFLTTVTNVVRDLVVQAFPEHAEKVLVVPNPVDFSNSPRRDEPPTSLDDWVFVGGLTEIKGVERLIKGFTQFARVRRAAHLTLYGEGPLRPELEESVADAGLSDRVSFRGAVPHQVVLSELPRYDVLVAPSRYETFHLAVAEGVAAGLPVVVTRSGGPEEAIGATMRLCGEFIDVGDDAAGIVDGVLSVEARLDELDLADARRELAGRYGTEAVRAQLADLYGVAAWQPGKCEVAAGTPPDRVELFSRRTWRAPAVEPQVSLASSHGVEVHTVGVPQTKSAAKLSVAARALRKARRMAAQLRPSRPSAQGRTTALLGDFTSAPDVLEFWEAAPGARPSVELDPTDFGEPPVDAVEV